MHSTWDHNAPVLPLITLACSVMVVSWNLSVPGWHNIPADECNYICSFWTGFLTMLRLYLFKADILILQKESALAFQLAVQCVQGIPSAGWHRNACSAHSDTWASLSAAVGKLTVTWELSHSHCVRSAIELSFMIQGFHYPCGAPVRFCYINRIPVFSKSIQTLWAGTLLPGLLLDV